MTRKGERRTRNVCIRLNAEEYQIFEREFKRSVHRTVAGYARDRILKRPIVIRYRDQTLDDYLELACLLQHDLDAIASNVRKALSLLKVNPTASQETIQYLSAGQSSLDRSMKELNDLFIKIYDLCTAKFNRL